MAKKQTKTLGRKPNAKHSQEFIDKALATWDRMRADGKQAADVARAVGGGISPGMLYYWKSKKEGRPWGKAERESQARKIDRAVSKLAAPLPARAQSMVARRPNAANHSAEVAGLEREIATLREEIEILTKTVMVFARSRR